MKDPRTALPVRMLSSGRTVRVRTDHVYPPIGTRLFDWSAVDDARYDGAEDAGFQPIGRGTTEQAAIDDLISQIEEHEA